MKYDSEYIFKIPEINLIIEDYKNDLEIHENHKRIFNKSLKKIKSIIVDIDIFDRYVFVFKYLRKPERIDFYEVEVCRKCGNFTPYIIDINVSSTYNQFCKCPLTD